MKKITHTPKKLQVNYKKTKKNTFQKYYQKISKKPTNYILNVSKKKKIVINIIMETVF